MQSPEKTLQLNYLKQGKSLEYFTGLSGPADCVSHKQAQCKLTSGFSASKYTETAKATDEISPSIAIEQTLILWSVLEQEEVIWPCHM